MKIKTIIVFIVVIVINIFYSNINIVQADSGVSGIISSGDNFIKAGKNENDVVDTTKMQSTSKEIVNILIVIGMCVAVVTIAVLGIKFMLGSIEEKAQIKESLVPFIIGCIVVFGAFGIWEIFITIGKRLG